MKSPDEKYFDYKNNVLRNRVGLTSTRELHIFEGKVTVIRIAELKLRPIPKRITMSDYKMIHYHIFQDVYEWAGQYREVNIQKGDTSFLPFLFLHNAEQQMNRDITKFMENPDGSENVVCEQLSDLLIDLNYMHPFREGNGRTQREFIRQLAEIKGYTLNISMDNHFYMEASIEDDKAKMYHAIKKDIRVHS